MTIRRPLSPGRGWTEVSLFREYADRALRHLNAEGYFEAILISCVGYDVLLNTLLDRIRLNYFEKLTPKQKKAIERIERTSKPTAGKILEKLKNDNILHWRLHRALFEFNEDRNKVIHPFERQEKDDANGCVYSQLSLKAGAIVPYTIKKQDAEKYFRWYCHIIDLSGGESPRKYKKEEKLSGRNSFSSILKSKMDDRKRKKYSKRAKGT